nr:efflux RND transporter permease subunit [Pseudomonas luteola]
MPDFFIRRPVFAWVVALFILLAGVLAIPNLPVAQYPNVAPPQIEITATYPGATPQTLDESVVSLIEQELNGVNHLLYFSSSSSQGMATLTVTFKPGTDPELGKVDIQNRLKTIESRLPRAVTQQGLRLRPIVMTSLAFILGVVPLAIATGASSASQQAIGTSVIGGMLTATFAVVFVPVFFVSVMHWVSRLTRSQARGGQRHE